MSKLSPVVEPTLDGLGNLTTATGVDVKVIYQDVGANDSILVKWGIYDAISPSGITQQNLPKAVPIPAKHICDGSATLWFSIQDAIGNLSYSTEVMVPITTDGAQVLAAPKITAVDTTNPAVGMLVTIVDSPAFDLVLAVGDLVIVNWDIVATSDGASLNHQSKTYTLTASPNGSYTTPPLTTIPVGQQSVIVTYTLTRAQTGQLGADGSSSPNSNQVFNSASAEATAQSLWPGGGPPAQQLPAPVFPNAVAGVLNMDTVPAGDIQLQIPTTTDIAMTNVTFIGAGRDATGQEIPTASWTAGPVFVNSTPYSGTPIPRANVNAVPAGGSYSVYYQAGGLTSVSTTVSITRGAAQPPNAGTGELWGWGDPEWGTLG
jgi:hypothetical protein